MGFEWLKPGVVLGSLVYALIGGVIFWLCFLIIDKITPYDVALGLVVAAMSLGISIIVAAAIH